MTDSFDFTQQAEDMGLTPQQAQRVAAAIRSPLYDATIAKQLFEFSKTEERVEADGVVFEENAVPAKGGFFSKAITPRMYFVVEGEITLSAAGRTIDTIRPGEIFGEMAVITNAPRSATATAKVATTLYSLDQAQLQKALSTASPSFALMLMSVLIDRLRLVDARLAARKVTSGRLVGREGAAFDAALLKSLQATIEHPTVSRFAEGKTIMKQGEVGVSMYIVLEGRVAIHVGENRVETITAGGAFGEMALLSQAPRTATATARTECQLLSLTRPIMITLVEKHPAFGMAILQALAERLRFMNGLLH
jgi:CRP/FNR family transcriptional regulator, cyclic AMP receptor protein